MEKTNILIALIFILFVLYPIFFRRKNKHQRKMANAESIITTVNAIPHPGQKLAYLRKIDPYAFEELILTLLQRKGFVIARNKRYSGDGGIDGRFEHNKKTWLIQAKRYSDRIKQEHVSDFAEVLIERGCCGIFVHTGRTPKSVREFIENHGPNSIVIISGQRLLNLFDSSIKLTF